MMNHVKCLFAVLAITMIVGAAQADIVCYYPMNGTTPGVDATGNGFDVVDGGVSPFTSPGYTGDVDDQYGQFDGNIINDVLRKDTLTTAEAAMISADNFTIEAWVRNTPKPSDWPTHGAHDHEQLGIFQCRNGGGRVEFRLAPSGDDGYVLGLAGDRVRTDVSWSLISSDAFSLEDDQWYHVAITYNNNGTATANDSTITFYCTALGEEAEPVVLTQLTGQDDLKSPTAGGPLYIGGADDSVTRTFIGDLDEVRYSNAVLAPGEMLYAAVPEPSTAVLIIGGLLGLGLAGRRRQS